MFQNFLCKQLIKYQFISKNYSLYFLAGSRESRTLAALQDIGPAVLNGGFSTFLAFIFTAGSTSHVFLSFFKVSCGASAYFLFALFQEYNRSLLAIALFALFLILILFPFLCYMRSSVWRLYSSSFARYFTIPHCSHASFLGYLLSVRKREKIPFIYIFGTVYSAAR